MNKLLPNLLIVIALALCGFNVVQWVREAKLHGDKQVLSDTIHKKLETIQNLELHVKRTEAEITRLDGIRQTLNENVKSNRLEIASLTKQLDKVEKELELTKRQGEVYKDALDTANEAIRRQNEDIKKQNEDLKQLVEDRNGIAEKFNKLTQDYNELVGKWNQQQEELRKAAEQAQAAAGASPNTKKQ
jgi:chromosome segregation ATPase